MKFRHLFAAGLAASLIAGLAPLHSHAQAPPAAPGKMGMTWVTRTDHPHPVTGTAAVSCHRADKTSCDPYKGDTRCDTPLQILCITQNKDLYPQPASVTNDPGQWTRWAFGIVGTTKPMAAPSTLSAANKACEAEFGKGWRVAEHHDGAGWGLKAFGGVGSQSKKFWVDIKNQPNAICWDRSK